MQNNFRKFKKVPLLLSLLIFALACFVFIFLYKKIQNNNQTLGEAQTRWQIETAKKNEITSIENALKTTETERGLLDAHFIQSSDVVPFLDTVERLASQAGAQAEITSVNLSSDNISLVTEIAVAGTFESLYKFLTLLENSPYQLEVVSMDMRTTSAESKSGENVPAPMWSATFKIKLLDLVA